MVTTIDAANGDTQYAISGPLVLMPGDKSDGSAVWIANGGDVTVTVEWSGAHAGIGRINLTGQGDSVRIPAGDVTVITVSASAYPATIGYAYLDPAMDVRTAQTVTNRSGYAGGIVQTVTAVGVVAVAIPTTAQAGRATMLVQNVGATTIYLGASTVTADTTATGGLQLVAGQSIPIDLSGAVTLYAISSAAGGLVMTLEVAA